MKYREIEYLTNSKEFIAFKIKYNLDVKIEKGEKIFLSSRFLIVEIYSFCVESIFYFDVYTIDYKWYSNIDRLLEKMDQMIIQSILKKEIEKRTTVLSPRLQSNEDRTLRSEQNFFACIAFFDLLLSDFLIQKEKIDFNLFSESSQAKRIELERIYS